MRDHYTKTYIGLLFALGTMLCAAWSYRYGVELDPAIVTGALAFAVLILLGEIFPINVGDRSTVGVWDIGLTVAVVALGPTWASVAALPAALYAGRKEILRLVFEVSHVLVITYLAGIVFSLSSAPLLLDASASTPQIVYGTLAAGVVLSASNKSVFAMLLRVKYGRLLQDTWREYFSPYLLSDFINVLTAGFGVLALIVYGPVAAFVAVGGAIGSQVLVYRSRDQLRENRELKERIRSLESSLTTSNLTFGAMMIRDLGRRDGYMDRHAAATSVYAADIARELRLDELHAERLGMAGLLHNIGMFSLPAEIVSATGKLNSLARSELEKHPVRGEQALAAVPEFREMASWVRWHHERLDGRGYPDKLRATWIPTEARILAVAQAYAAMVIDQPRRPGATPSEARGQLNAGIDTEFDGVVVRAFARILDAESEGYRMADDYRFVFPKPGSGSIPEGLRNAHLSVPPLSEAGDETSGPRDA